MDWIISEFQEFNPLNIIGLIIWLISLGFWVYYFIKGDNTKKKIILIPLLVGLILIWI